MRLARVSKSLDALNTPERNPLSDPRGVFLETPIAIGELKAVMDLLRSDILPRLIVEPPQIRH